MKFGVMFFSCDSAASGRGKYDFLMEAARFADRHAFSSVWTPERHFHRFGGLFPNPAVTSAALAMATIRIGIRAGSVVSPLHDVIRIAEEWAVVDNLSSGRVGLSFAPGWAMNDFVLAPSAYADRKDAMYAQMSALQTLWRGESLRRRNPQGEEVDVRIFPAPVQPSLPVWVTSSGNPETFKRAGAVGANVLTHLLGQGQSLEGLRASLAGYHEALAAAGHDRAKTTVTLMLHSFLGKDPAAVRAEVEKPFKEYLRTAFQLDKEQEALRAKGGDRAVVDQRAAKLMDQMLDIAYEKYVRTAALIGTPDSVQPLVEDLRQAGVTEIACLIDFGVRPEAALTSLAVIDELARRY